MMSNARRTGYFVHWTLVACAACLFLPSASAQVADWTFMVYLDGDNNIEEAAIDDFLEMASVGSDSNVNILVLFDRIAGYDDRYGDWTNTHRGKVEKNDTPNRSWGTSMGELNMGDPQTLIDFVEWGMQNHAASRYALVLWDHGGGWRIQEVEKKPYKSVCFDDTDGDELRMAELRSALETIGTDEQAPDLTGFDACLMGMIEVAYEIRDQTSVMVASEKMVPFNGWPYNTILGDLTGDPTMGAVQLGDDIVARYYQSYSNSEVMSSSRLSRVENLAEWVDEFAQRLRIDWNSDHGACAEAASEVMLALEDAVSLERHGSSWPDSHGLAVYFPENSADFSSDYNKNTILFAADTVWDEFLQDFYNNMTTSWVADARQDSQEYDTCTGPSGCPYHIDLYDFARKIIDHADGVLWVDFAYAGPEFGTYDEPYSTLEAALNASNPGDTIIMKAGSSDETPRINEQVTLRSSGGTAGVGFP